MGNTLLATQKVLTPRVASFPLIGIFLLSRRKGQKIQIWTCQKQCNKPEVLATELPLYLRIYWGGRGRRNYTMHRWQGERNLRAPLLERCSYHLWNGIRWGLAAGVYDQRRNQTSMCCVAHPFQNLRGCQTLHLAKFKPQNHRRRIMEVSKERKCWEDSSIGKASRSFQKIPPCLRNQLCGPFCPVATEIACGHTDRLHIRSDAQSLYAELLAGVFWVYTCFVYFTWLLKLPRAQSLCVALSGWHLPGRISYAIASRNQLQRCGVAMAMNSFWTPAQVAATATNLWHLLWYTVIFDDFSIATLHNFTLWLRLEDEHEAKPLTILQCWIESLHRARWWMLSSSCKITKLICGNLTASHKWTVAHCNLSPTQSKWMVSNETSETTSLI